MMPPPSAAEVHGTNDYLLGFFVGKTTKKSPPKIGEEPEILADFCTRHSADLFSIIVFIEGRTEKINDIL